MAPWDCAMDTANLVYISVPGTQRTLPRQPNSGLPASPLRRGRMNINTPSTASALAG